ncbi:macrophage colony-stimulating factor 1 receptor 2 [Myripristis murdjan]|uniref:macrophage colony-stimulating factor 1 receptor 2 n=1 Tax=Myripristis murdjan TaxID=586833 RepID=UPI0011763F82|nr:macrophage colony-stimulating factor 1 receptor 2-like [Myripristis murdjan]
MCVHVLLLSIALSCSAEDAAPPPSPVMYLNSELQPNQTEELLTVGSGFNLSCHGNGPVRWFSTAFNLRYDDLTDTVEVKHSNLRHTGTYRCGYKNRSLEHVDAWIHLYVSDPADPSSLFVTPISLPVMREGRDFLFECLLTDPSVTKLTFRLQVDGGRGLPRGMNVTLDPRRGALIRGLRTSYSETYVCSAWRDNTELSSAPFTLLVIPRYPLPSVSINPDEFVRLEGEKLVITCVTSYPSHFYFVTWTHPHLQALNISTSRLYSNRRLYINSTVTVAAVSHTHSGTFTCTAFSRDGETKATATLRVVGGSYLKVYLQHSDASSRTVEPNGKLVANVSAHTVGVGGEPSANVSSDKTEVNGVGCANVSGASRVDVDEDQDVKLTFVMEAYPPISFQRWTSTHNNTAHQEHYSVNNYRAEASLLLLRVRQQDRGCYSLHFSSSVFSGSQSVHLRVSRAPEVAVEMRNGSLTCSSSGYPLPTILWYICPGVMDTCGDNATYQVPEADGTSGPEEEKEEQVQRFLAYTPSTSDDVTVECVAQNRVGSSRDAFVVHAPGPVVMLPPRQFFTPTLIGALTVATFLLLLLLVVLYKYKQKPRYEIRWKIIESNHGNNYTFIDPAQLPYNQKWEFPRDQLRLGAVLGSGAFGKVVEATAFGLGTNQVTRVAVKMLKPSAHSEEREALMSELKILSHLGYHDNIVNLLGACTRGGPMLMITEYCSHGDLLNFLRERAQDFLSVMQSEEEAEEAEPYKNTSALPARVRTDSGISCCSEYQEMQPVFSSQTDGGGQTDSWCFDDLMRFSYQVAQGLEFLSSRNCIHRDVAARNVLLTNRRVAKICDFGLARDIRDDDSYIVQGNARLPVKWMAPESIFQCVYTVQSDVWSYGVLLWEIFSLGKSPYPNVVVDTNFYKMIKDGRHMAQPDFAPPEMYQLMIGCWSLEPTQRPTFNTIGQLVKKLLPSSDDALRHHSNQTYRNVQESREEEEEEGRGATLKRGEEEGEPGEEEEEVMKNIYQLS